MIEDDAGIRLSGFCIEPFPVKNQLIGEPPLVKAPPGRPEGGAEVAMVKGTLPAYQAFRNVEAVEAFATSLERNMQELPLLLFLMDRVRFGVEAAR